MLILLPSESSNVNMLTRDLQHDRISSILSQLQPTEVAVELPRFEIEFETDVVDYLKLVSCVCCDSVSGDYFLFLVED